MPDIPIAAVVGHPVSHSLSPDIFGFLSTKLKRPLVYRRIDLTAGEVTSFFDTVRDKGLFLGWNVTIPHKETLARHLRDLSDEARALRAVNVVHFSSTGARGYNTDVYGVSQTLRERRLRLRGRSAVLLGAGGAARAVAWALGQAGLAEVAVWNRTPARARTLCQALNRQFKTRFVTVSSPEEYAADAVLWVQTTPAGMKEVAVELPLPARARADAFAFDLVYRPAITPFLRWAGALGMSSVNGLDMLAWQALATWEIWFGRLKSREIWKDKLCRYVI